MQVLEVGMQRSLVQLSRASGLPKIKIDESSISL